MNEASTSVYSCKKSITHTVTVTTSSSTNKQKRSKSHTTNTLAKDDTSGVVFNKKFPWKFHKLLEDIEKSNNASIASWICNGRAFQVHDRITFMESIVKKYFNQKTFKSFQRQLYMYGFQRVRSGKNKGAYFHRNFIRDNRPSCLLISRQKAGLEASPSTDEVVKHRRIHRPQAKDAIRSFNKIPHRSMVTTCERGMRYSSNKMDAPRRNGDVSWFQANKVIDWLIDSGVALNEIERLVQLPSCHENLAKVQDFSQDIMMLFGTDSTKDKEIPQKK